MPIYEFRCESCQEVFEHLAMGRQDGLDTRCPACGGEQLSRVLSTCASVVNASPSQAAPSCAGVQNRSCANAGSCSTITLPGHTR